MNRPETYHCDALGVIFVVALGCLILSLPLIFASRY